jgi:hypothetical protein
MLVISFIVNFISFLFGSSLFSIIASLIVYVLVIRYLILPMLRLLMPLAMSVIAVTAYHRQPYILLELTPPAHTDTTPQTTADLLTALHHLLLSGSWFERMLLGGDRLSLELAASKSTGIRYLLRVSEPRAAVLETLLLAYQPDLRITKTKDYLPVGLDSSSPELRLSSFTQAGYFAYPIKALAEDETHDFIGYIAGAMTKLQNHELMALQIALESSLPSTATRLRNHLQAGADIHVYSFWLTPLRALSWSTRTLLEALGLLNGGKVLPNYSSDRGIRELMIDKLAQPLFRADIRTIVLTDDENRARQRLAAIRSALSLFSRPGYQGLRERYSSNLGFAKKYRLFQYKNRLNSLLPSDSSWLATSELAGLFHFPYGQAIKTENLIRSRSRTLPAPLSLKNGTHLDVILGRNHHKGTMTEIGLTALERERHVYIIGGTGNGKTTMLESAIVSDIQGGKGVAVIDPHGDLATTLLRFIPPERIEDVVYFNPRDYDYPIGLNLLELPVGLTGSELAHEKDMVTEAVISVLRKIFDDQADGNAYRIERILRNSIHTAFTIDDATIFTILRLLTDRNYRKKMTARLQDESLRRFWKEELDLAGDMQRIKIAGGPIARIERFERSESARRVLGQARSTINFDELMNTGKILICNFSKGNIGEDTSALFGTTVLAKLQLAAWRRQDIAPEKRRPFYLYVDEFQNFANDSFQSILTESRKYRLFLTLAEQSTAQQDEKLIEVMLNNIGTVICFRTGSPRDERLILHQFSPLIQPGDITNLPAYSFYIRIAADKVYEPFSGETLLLKKEGSPAIARLVQKASRSTYAVQYEAAESASESTSAAVIMPKEIVST